MRTWLERLEQGPGSDHPYPLDDAAMVAFMQSPEYDALFARLELKRTELQKTATNKASNPATMDAETIKALESLGYLEKAAD